jgi:hypothetical protein
MFASTDETFANLLSACLSHSSICPLAASGNETVSSLTTKIRTMLSNINAQPLVYAPPLLAPFQIDITYTYVKEFILSSLYRPREYINLAIALDGLVKNNATPFGDIYLLPYLLPSSAAGNTTAAKATEAIYGIRCGDKAPREAILPELMPVINEYRNMSWVIGAEMAYVHNPACAQWGFVAKERYTGDFKVKTAKPMLFIGNTFDPVTPMISARNMSSGFVGSVLLHHNASGVSWIIPFD